jgi:hypothetical protein
MDKAMALFRVTRAVHGPWWFSDSGEGRFDLKSPEGTCYTSVQAIAAVLEVIGPNVREGVVSQEFIEQRVLYTLELREPASLAMLANRAAAGFGLTHEIHTITPYDLPQAWARHLRKAGFDGLRYSVRHDPAPNDDGIALFGEAGEATDRRHSPPSQIGSSILQQLEQHYRIRVAPIPAKEDLTFE